MSYAYMLISMLIILGFSLLICGLFISPFRKNIRLQQNSSKQTKGINNILGDLESKKIIQKILNFTTKNKSNIFCKMSAKMLSLSEVGINLQRLYLIKIIGVILCTLILFVIRYTNMQYEIKTYIASSSVEGALFYEDNSYDETKYQLYKEILSSVGNINLLELSDTELHQVIGEVIAHSLNTTDRSLIDSRTKWFMEKWSNVQHFKLFRYQHFAIILGAFFLPELILLMIWLLRGCIYKKEIIKLEYVFELLAGIDGIKTSDIITELEKSSKIYSTILNTFSQIFKYDKHKALEYLRKSTNSASIVRLADVIEIYCLTDKEVALQILEREVLERDEALIMTAEENLDIVDLIAFLSIVPMIYELARLMLKPMLDVIYKAFEFI